MMELRINTTQFTQQLDLVAYRQLPFALSRSLNAVALDAVQEEIKDLPGKFIVRRQWVAKGFRVEFARKVKLVATIKHKDPFVALQEFGGEKRPKNTKDVAIPEAARPTPQAITRPSRWPGRLKRSFYIRKGDTIYEYARTGRRTRQRHKRKGELLRNLALEKRGFDPALKLMYVFKAVVHIKPRLGMAETARQIAARNFPGHFARELDNAIRTAK